MFFSTYLQVSLILYLGISLVDSQTSFYSHLLVFERTKDDDLLVENYVCLGTSIHFLWAVVHENCINETRSAELGYVVAPTMGPELFDEIYYLRTYYVRGIFRSSDLIKDLYGLILLRVMLETPIQTIGNVEIKIGKVPHTRLLKPSLCKTLLWHIKPNPYYNTTGLLPIIRQVWAKPDVVKRSENYSISVYTNRSLCQSVPGSLLSCNNKIQAVGGILIEKSCSGRNKHISFVDIASFRQLFRDVIEDFEWVQNQNARHGRTDRASCFGTTGYVLFGFIIIVHNMLHTRNLQFLSCNLTF